MLRINVIKAIGVYAGAVIICLFLLIFVMNLWKADLAIPFAYGRDTIFTGADSLFTGAVIKGIIDNGWYLHNSFVGMPTGLVMYDFPMADNFHFVLVKLISLFTHDYAKTLNLYLTPEP